MRHVEPAAYFVKEQAKSSLSKNTIVSKKETPKEIKKSPGLVIEYKQTVVLKPYMTNIHENTLHSTSANLIAEPVIIELPRAQETTIVTVLNTPAIEVEQSEREPTIPEDEIITEATETDIRTMIHTVQDKIAELDPIATELIERLIEEIATILAGYDATNLLAETDKNDVDTVENEIVTINELAKEVGVIAPKDPIEVLVGVLIMHTTTAEDLEELGSSDTEQKLIVAITQIAELLDMKIDSPQIRRLASKLIESKEVRGMLIQESQEDRGTHEVLQHFGTVLRGVEDILEPVHALLGRIVLATHM